MTIRQSSFACALFLVAGILPATAADIMVLSAGAMKAVVLALAPEFEAKTGHRLTVDTGTVGGLRKRITEGEAFDVAIITPPIIDELATAGKIDAANKGAVAKVGVGVAVKDGAPKPDIGSAHALKNTLLAAKSITYVDPKAGGSSGIYFNSLIDKLGIGDAVRAKAKLLPGGYVGELVAKGEIEIAVHQISELLPVKGIQIVGPLPAEVQNFTTYGAGASSAARDAGAAKAFVAYLKGDAALAVLKAKGMEKP